MNYTPLRRYYRGDELVAVRDVPAGTTRYYHFDHQGTTQALTDSTGAVTDRFASDAWGVEVKRTGSSINRQWYIGRSGYYRHVGQAIDYVRARYCVPAIGAWISEDPLYAFRFYPVMLAQSIHAFAYAANSPTIYSDPSGLSACKVIGTPPIPLSSTYDCDGGQAFTGCDGKGGTWTAFSDCRCPENDFTCTGKHEAIHRGHYTGCCQRLALCLKQGRKDCIQVLTDWGAAISDYSECQAYKVSQECRRAFYKRLCAGCSVPDKLKNCCDLMRGRIKDHEDIMKDYCKHAKGAVPCYFDARGNPIKPYPK